MPALVSPVVAHSVRISLATHAPCEFVDLTDRLEEVVAEAGIRCGILNVQTRHTTTGLVVNEHEAGLLVDFRELLDGIAPTSGRYRHDDFAAREPAVEAGERVNGHAHCRALLLPAGVSLNVTGGRLDLGQWQRVFLIELDGPRQREVSVLALGDAEARP